MNRSRTACLIAVCLLVTAPAAHAGGWTVRPLDDFLATQGATSTFVPPVPDYAGWVDADFVTFALVDYAGLAAGWIEDATGGAESLGTEVRGKVMERAAADGRAKVRIRLVTSRALSWAFRIADVDFSDPLFFLTTPLAFGARAQDVVGGATPALGKAHLDVTFTNSAPGAPLPDLVQLGNAPLPEQLPVTFRVRSHTCGATPDGTPARLTINQVCSDAGSGQVCAAAAVEIAPLASACDDGDDETLRRNRGGHMRRTWTVALVALVLAATGCAQGLQVQKPDGNAVRSRSKHVVLLTQSKWDARLTQALADEGFRVDAAPGTATTGVAMAVGNQVDVCLVNENIKVDNVTLTVTDLGTQKTLVTVPAKP